MKHNDPLEFPPDDPVGRLNVHYFEPCELLLRDFKKLRGFIAPDKFHTPNGQRARLYLSLRLAMLYVVVEGFRKLKLYDETIMKLVKQPHFDLLRKFRNAVFHFEETPNPLVEFLKAKGAMEWAENLQGAFRTYFSEYRVEFWVQGLVGSNRPATN